MNAESSTPHHIRATHPEQGAGYVCSSPGGIGPVGVVDEPGHASCYATRAKAERGLLLLRNSIDCAPGFLEGWRFEILEGAP